MPTSLRPPREALLCWDADLAQHIGNVSAEANGGSIMVSLVVLTTDGALIARMAQAAADAGYGVREITYR